jgi:hypothetical protein
VSLRARAESWLRTFDAMDTIDLVTRLGLVAILVSDHVAGYEWYLKAPTRGRASAGLLVPTLARRSSFWGVLTFAFTLRTLTDWWFQDNHLFVFTYWCLTLALALRLAQPLPALATSARLLVGLSFALATLWKAFLSPDYMDGTYFHHTVLTDPRFRDLGAILGRVPESLYTANLDQLARLRAWRPDVQEVSVQTTWAMGILSQVLTWWTVGIEALLGLCFLWPREGGPRRIRNWVLLLFGWTTYAVATVPTFGWTLMTLGAAQCEPGERVERLLYAVTCALILIYAYVEILSLVRPFVPAP